MDFQLELTRAYLVKNRRLDNDSQLPENSHPFRSTIGNNSDVCEFKSIQNYKYGSNRGPQDGFKFKGSKEIVI